jgi:hypothetical protein
MPENAYCDSGSSPPRSPERFVSAAEASTYPGATAERRDETATSTKRASLLAGLLAADPLWTPEQVALRLNVSADWVRDHSSRKQPRLPVIRLGSGPGRAGLLRYRASAIERFIEEMECLSQRNLRRI